jgi:hypothetical protein
MKTGGIMGNRGELLKIVIGAAVAINIMFTGLSAQEAKRMSSTNKQQVTELLKSIETGAAGPVSYINANKYIQHNLAAMGWRALPPCFNNFHRDRQK